MFLIALGYHSGALGFGVLLQPGHVRPAFLTVADKEVIVLVEGLDMQKGLPAWRPRKLYFRFRENAARLLATLSVRLEITLERICRRTPVLAGYARQELAQLGGCRLVLWSG